jgi:diguanylate cyclase
VNIVIVENSEIIRAQLVRILATQPRIRITGVASEEETAVSLIVQSKPDAVLLDLALSPGSGVRVLQRVREQGCGARVLVLTNNTDTALQDMCEKLGVSGFFDKTNEAEQCLGKLFSWLPPLPANERNRLQALHAARLLDTPEQEAYDNIAQIARDVTGTPIALVSLVDEDRQWLLSHQGMEIRETSRSIAFCAHTIMHCELLEISDAMQDDRFHDNPMVTGEPNIRYYAGVPLVLPSGEVLGTLCVMDKVTRYLSEAQKRTLKTLAHSVVGEIELRRRMLRLEQEVDRRHAAEMHILEMATRDPLTHLPNRVALRDRLDQHLKQAQRQFQKVAFLFVDLDRFKLINDTLGHDVGDSALLEVARRLTRTLRESDTVARLGGDEFAVLLPDAGNVEAAMATAAKLNQALGEATILKGYRLHFEASIGVAIYPDHGDGADQLMRHADLAMYQAKQSGGGRVCSYSPDLDARAWDLLALENDLRDALERHEIVAFFQPQVILSHTGLCGAEALARWRHPQLGLLGPEQFIGFAESRGFIGRIGQRMLNLALAQLKAWDVEGIYVPRIAVNVSAMELREGYVEAVEEALVTHGVPPSRLELEITESALAAENLAAIAILQSLRRRGVSISVDDFGVGYSSLGQMRRMPIDSLKIDKSFVTEIGSSEQDVAIVSAVVTMARSLGLRTLAEGAETEAQLATLRGLGCDCVQGYVVARPLPAAEFSQWMRAFEQGSGLITQATPHER